MKLRLLTFALSLLVLTACSKNDEEITNVETLEAKIQWAGTPNAGGCGYLITTCENCQTLKPENESDIPDTYKTGEPIAVRVDMINYKERAIGCKWGVGYTKIKVLKIQKI